MTSLNFCRRWPQHTTKPTLPSRACWTALAWKKVLIIWCLTRVTNDDHRPPSCECNFESIFVAWDLLCNGRNDYVMGEAVEYGVMTSCCACSSFSLNMCLFSAALWTHSASPEEQALLKHQPTCLIVQLESNPDLFWELQCHHWRQCKYYIQEPNARYTVSMSPYRVM